MSYEALGAAALNYAPCRYDGSRLLFRGPARRLDVPYAAFIGGTDTYGKFIKTPFPALLEVELGLTCVNFGMLNAGVDVLCNDSFLTGAANASEVTVLQIVGAQNLSNRYYAVHPRRNDRFLKASRLLKSVYPEVDFSEFHFTRHMLSALFRTSPVRFEAIRDELQKAWVGRMKIICAGLTGKTVLLWFSDHKPFAQKSAMLDPGQDGDPLFVTRRMVNDLATRVTCYSEVVVSKEAVEAGTTGMVFSEMEASAARRLLGPKAHAEAASALAETLRAFQ